MIIVYISLVITDIALFLAGFYTGLWIQRRSYLTREIEKLIPVDKIVEVEKPIVVQVPVAPISQSKQGPSLPVMGTRRSVISDPVERGAAERMTEILGQLPEV